MLKTYGFQAFPNRFPCGRDHRELQVKNKNNETVAILPTANSLSTGEHYIEWNGQAPDGIYNFEITASDQAGNTQTSTTPIEFDGTPPSLNQFIVNPDPMTLARDKLTYTVEATETANVILTVTNKTILQQNTEKNESKQYQWIYPIFVKYDVDSKKYIGEQVISYQGSLNNGLPDGRYSFGLQMTDTAGNTRIY